MNSKRCHTSMAKWFQQIGNEPEKEAQATFYKGLKEVGGNEFEINVVYGKVQMKLFFWKMQQLQNTLLKDNVLAGQGWNLKFDFVLSFCTEQSLVRIFFETNCQIELM